MRYMIVAAVCMSLVLSTWIGTSHAQTKSEDSSLIQVLIESADTPAEHEALARYYRSKASEARGMAEMHRSMGQRYTGGNIAKKRQMRKHCDSLVKTSEQLATEYDRLAAIHDEAAAQP